MKTEIEPGVVVIGAGVVGLSAAIAAQARGLAVIVIEREAPAAGASAGNAGAFAFTDILPLASPGILRKAPKWLLDPLGPLSVTANVRLVMPVLPSVTVGSSIDSDTAAGVMSSSWIVSVALVGVPSFAPPVGLVRLTTTVSAGSLSTSFTIGTGIVLSVASPSLKVTVVVTAV